MYVFGPLGFWTMAPLSYAAKFDLFLSLDCARVEGVVKFCHLATMTKSSLSFPLSVFPFAIDFVPPLKTISLHIDRVHISVAIMRFWVRRIQCYVVHMTLEGFFGFLELPWSQQCSIFVDRTRLFPVRE